MRFVIDWMWAMGRWEMDDEGGFGIDGDSGGLG